MYSELSTKACLVHTDQCSFSCRRNTLTIEHTKIIFPCYQQTSPLNCCVPLTILPLQLDDISSLLKAQYGRGSPSNLEKVWALFEKYFHLADLWLVGQNNCNQIVTPVTLRISCRETDNLMSYGDWNPISRPHCPLYRGCTHSRYKHARPPSSNCPFCHWKSPLLLNLGADLSN